MILLIDNYDSFTWNLVQRLGEIEPRMRVEVHRNDCIDGDTIAAKQPSHLLISPGPCNPDKAGISCDVVRVSPAACRFSSLPRPPGCWSSFWWEDCGSEATDAWQS